METLRLENAVSFKSEKVESIFDESIKAKEEDLVGYRNRLEIDERQITNLVESMDKEVQKVLDSIPKIIPD